MSHGSLFNDSRRTRGTACPGDLLHELALRSCAVDRRRHLGSGRAGQVPGPVVPVADRAEAVQRIRATVAPGFAQPARMFRFRFGLGLERTQVDAKMKETQVRRFSSPSERRPACDRFPPPGWHGHYIRRFDDGWRTGSCSCMRRLAPRGGSPRHGRPGATAGATGTGGRTVGRISMAGPTAPGPGACGCGARRTRHRWHRRGVAGPPPPPVRSWPGATADVRPGW